MTDKKIAADLVKDFSYLTDMAYTDIESREDTPTTTTEKVVLELKRFLKIMNGSGFKIPSKARWPRSPAGGQNVHNFIWLLRILSPCALLLALSGGFSTTPS